jgi:hypothetical protein
MASQGPNNNQEDIVDTIAQYDLDEDFPDYANEQNKELNQIVSLSTFLPLFKFVTYFFRAGKRKSASRRPTRLGNRGASGKA